MDEAFVASVRGWKGWQEATRDPQRASEEVWNTIRPLLHQGAFWPDRIDADAPLSEYPVTTFEDYAETLDRCWELDYSLLNGEPLIHWVLSSGSTGEQKKFPGTATFRDQFERGMRATLPVVKAMARARGRRGGHLAFTPPHTDRRTPAGVPIGYLTPLYFPNDGSVFPSAVNHDAEGIGRWRPAYCAARDIQSLFMVTSEPAHHLLARLHEDRDFYRGLFAGDHALPDALPPLTFDPGRREHLLHLLSSNEPFALDALWPSIALLNTWRASTAGLQAARLAADCDKPVRVVDLPYNTSEGPIANPIDPDHIGGPIHPGAVIHEFLEPGAAGRPDELLKPWDLEVGRSYEIVLTTAMGLVRYRFGDIVRCVGFFGGAPHIHFDRRKRDELSLGAATFSESILLEALGQLVLPIGVQCVFGPSTDGRTLVLYTEHPVPAGIRDRLQQVLERINTAYADVLAKGYGAPVRVVPLGPQHPVWSRLRPAHDQAKRRFLLHTAP